MSFAETYHRVNSSHWVDPSTPPLPKEEHRSLRDSMLECLGEHPHRERYKRALDYANRPDNAERSPSSPLVLTRLNCAVDLQEDTLPGQLVATRNYLTHWSDKKMRRRELPDLGVGIEKLGRDSHRPQRHGDVSRRGPRRRARTR